MSINKIKRFQKIAPKRVQKVLDSMNSLSKCSNKYNYEYTEKEKNKIFNALNKSMTELKAKFNDGVNNKKKFEL
tara:strand:+ start:259 stop:480 length:222 start_codon:yes stop_codon:yes gene_type:complete